MPVSSDEDEDETTNVAPTHDNGDEGDVDNEKSKPTKGKLKPVRKSSRQQPLNQPTPVSSLQDAGSEEQSSKARAANTRPPVNSTQTSPKKGKSTKAKSKPIAQDESKPKTKPIFSFFNAATQRQQSSQPTPSPAKSSTPQEEAETIDSDDDNPTSLSLSKDSSVALAMRKRKPQHRPSSQGDSSLLPPHTQKFRKTSDGGRTPSLAVVNEDKRPWVVQFGPSNLDELAVHKRKVADVRHWLDAAYAGRRQRVLVLKGAAGSAKTTTIELLAKDLGAQVTEWKNPAGNDLTAEGSMTASAQFEDFVGRAGKSSGLKLVSAGDDELAFDHDTSEQSEEEPDANTKQLLLVEEFPNTFSRTSPALTSFRSALSQYLASPPVAVGTPTPIVLVISETLLSTSTAAADSFTAHRLLGPELLNNPWLDTIEFNAIAPTIMTKALEGIVVKEARKSGRRKTPGPLVLKHLAEIGDIRSAVSSLEFLCLRGDEGDTWSSKVTFTKTKKTKSEQAMTKAEEEALKLISNRESSLGIFHSVGKIVYNKRQEPGSGTVLAQPPPWLPQHRRNKIPETDVDRLIDELGTDTTTYVAALHENYALSCSCQSSEESLDSVSGCIDSISDADLLSLDRYSFGTRAFSGSATDTLRQDEMSFQAAVRGVLFNLPCPVHRGSPPGGTKGDAHHMFYPTSLKIWRKKEEVNDLLELLISKMQRGDIDNTRSTRSRPSIFGEPGVASWKRENKDNDTDHGGRATIPAAKKEMLLDHLPYMARILQSPNTAPSSHLDQILGATRIRGSATTASDNNDDDFDTSGEQQQDGPDAEQQQWATDKPDADASDRLRGTKAKRKPAVRGKTEGGGLGIPVENQVEKLVLEDDDIVDD